MSRIHNFKNYIDESYNKNADLSQAKEDLARLKKELKQAWIDMENDPDIEPTGGPIADGWGEKIAKLETEVEKMEKKIEKLEKPREKKEEDPVAGTKKVLVKHIEEIKRSMTAWPDRTIEQAAEIYKKRYFHNNFDASLIVKALGELKDEKKLL